MDLSKDRLQNDNDNAILMSLDEHAGSIYRLWVVQECMPLVLLGMLLTLRQLTWYHMPEDLNFYQYFLRLCSMAGFVLRFSCAYE